MLRSSILVVLCALLRPYSLQAQQSPPAAKAIPLQEATTTKLPTTFRAVPPYHCDLDGRLYVRAHVGKGNDAIVRLKADGSPELTFSPNSVNNTGASYPVLYDYAPGPDGGLFLIALNVPSEVRSQEQQPMARTRVVLRFDNSAEYRGIVPVTGFAPSKIAVFSNGYLVVAGPRGDDLGAGPASSHWFTGIFKEDGTLIKRLAFSPSDLTAEKPDSAKHEQTAKTGRLTSEEATQRDRFNGQLELISAPDGFVYATLPSNVDGHMSGRTVVVAQISASGEIRYVNLSGAENEDLFFLVANGAHLFAGFARPDDQFTDLQELNVNFNLNEVRGSGQILSRFQILGAPVCVRDNQVFVLRPDQKGGALLVAYDLR